jgi:hypothetical protein
MRATLANDAVHLVSLGGTTFFYVLVLSNFRRHRIERDNELGRAVSIPRRRAAGKRVQVDPVAKPISDAILANRTARASTQPGSSPHDPATQIDDPLDRRTRYKTAIPTPGRTAELADRPWSFATLVGAAGDDGTRVRRTVQWREFQLSRCLFFQCSMYRTITESWSITLDNSSGMIANANVSSGDPKLRVSFNT